MDLNNSEVKNDKKALVTMIIGVVALVALVVGATYAYFTVTNDNNFGTKTIIANIPDLGSVALTSGASLTLNMTRALMMEDNIGAYYATPSGEPSASLTETNIATATVTGAGTFDCDYTITITPSATSAAKNLYTVYSGMSGTETGEIVLKVGNTTYDFKTATLSGPVNLTGKFEDLQAGSDQTIKASLKFTNTSSVQNALKGTDITFTFTASAFSCTAVNDPAVNEVVEDPNAPVSAMFIAGEDFYDKIDDDATTFRRVNSLPSQYENSSYVVSTSNSINPIYMWYNSANTSMDYYSESEKIYLNPDSSDMFQGASFTSLDLTGLDSSKVEDMNGMFNSCRSLTTLNISNFNTSKVTDMANMFYNCEVLTSLNLSSFDTSNVTNMQAMFLGTTLSTLNLSNFNTSKVTDMSEMFQYARVTSLDLSNFDTSNVSNMGNMFFDAINLSTLNLSGFDFSRLWTSYSPGLFRDNFALRTIDLTNAILPRNSSYMFYALNGASFNLTTITLTNVNTSYVTDMSYMFANNQNLVGLDLSSFNTSNVTNMEGMFDGDSSLTSLDLSSFNLLNVLNTDYMFRDVQVTTGYARTQAEANIFNNSLDIPNDLTFTVKNG